MKPQGCWWGRYVALVLCWKAQGVMASHLSMVFFCSCGGFSSFVMYHPHNATRGYMWDLNLRRFPLKRVLIPPPLCAKMTLNLRKTWCSTKNFVSIISMAWNSRQYLTLTYGKGWKAESLRSWKNKIIHFDTSRSIVRCSMDLPTNNPNPRRWPPRLEQLPPGWRHHVHLFDLTEGWKIPLKSTSTHNSMVTCLEAILKGNEKVFQPSRTSGAKMFFSGRVHFFLLEGNLQ